MSERRAVQVLIHGLVQGVGYRAWTERTAWRLRLDGYVRNRREGMVEAMFAGPAEAVERMLEACREGPPGARVTRIEIIGEGGSPATGFAVLDDA